MAHGHGQRRQSHSQTKHFLWRATHPSPHFEKVLENRIGKNIHVFGLMVNLSKKKLRSMILLHFGLITFRFAYGRDRQPLISMISGVRDF